MGIGCLDNQAALTEHHAGIKIRNWQVEIYPNQL